jgi:hypothetical protein
MDVALQNRRVMQMPVIKLLLNETNIPEDAFPTDEPVLLPTYARMVVRDATLYIDLILRDPYDDPNDGLPDFNSAQPRILPLTLARDEVVRVLVRNSWTRTPRIELYVRDPGHVYDELYLQFGPWSSNNPHYHIDAFARILQDSLAVPVSYEEKPQEPDWPF